jgi:hypothetical protein
MNDFVTLGESDVDARWVGVRRHQAVLVIVGMGLVGDWTIGTNVSVSFLVVGLALFMSAVPFVEGRTAAEFAATAVRFVARSHWLRVALTRVGGDLVIDAQGEQTFRGFELDHRGRFDLSGNDVVIADRIATMVNGLGARSSMSHVSIHLVTKPQSSQTLLALGADCSPVEGWRENTDLVFQYLHLSETRGVKHFLERWTYLRSDQQVLRVLRVSGYGATNQNKAFLEELQKCACKPEISLHLDVFTNTRARRVAARAVHQLGSDSAASSSVGFRRTARSQRALQRTAQREELVADGQALFHLGVYVVVRADSLRELHRNIASVITSAQDSGLTLERGRGNQLHWFRYQLPGGVGW